MTEVVDSEKGPPPPEVVNEGGGNLSEQHWQREQSGVDGDDKNKSEEWGSGKEEDN